MGAVPGPRPRSPSTPGRRHPGEAGPAGLADQLCGSWAARLVAVLGGGPVRFCALQAGLPGISHKVLTENLRRLQRDGLVLRTQTGLRPLAVQYSLTPLGQELGDRLASLRRWAQAREPDVLRARERYDAAALTPR